MKPPIIAELKSRSDQALKNAQTLDFLRMSPDVLSIMRSNATVMKRAARMIEQVYDLIDIESDALRDKMDCRNECLAVAIDAIREALDEPVKAATDAR